MYESLGLDLVCCIANAESHKVLCRSSFYSLRLHRQCDAPNGHQDAKKVPCHVVLMAEPCFPAAQNIDVVTSANQIYSLGDLEEGIYGERKFGKRNCVLKIGYCLQTNRISLLFLAPFVRCRTS